VERWGRHGRTGVVRAGSGRWLSCVCGGLVAASLRTWLQQLCPAVAYVSMIARENTEQSSSESPSDGADRERLSGSPWRRVVRPRRSRSTEWQGACTEIYHGSNANGKCRLEDACAALGSCYPMKPSLLNVG
jgi:hypothetical protein